MTTIDRPVAVELALRALSPSDGSVVYVDLLRREPGVVGVGPDEQHLTSPAVLVFRDEMPGANWMHPCTYALVDLQTGEVVRIVAADRPPVFGRLPDTWVVAADPGGRADLVTPADHYEGES